MKKELTGHIWALDMLKAFAIMGVIIQHCVYSGWAAGAARNAIITQAVPVFLTVTGITFSMSCVRRGTEKVLPYYKKQLFHNLWRMLWPYSLAYLFETYYHSVLWTRIDWLQYNADPAYDYYRFREMAAMYPTGGLGPGAYYIDLLLVVIALFPLLYWLGSRCWWAGLLFVVWGPQLYGGWLHGFWTRVPSAVFNVYLGILIYCFWNRIGKRTDCKPLWECGLAIVFMALFSSFEVTKAALLVLIALLILPWNFKNWPCRIFALLGKASFDIFIVQKIFFSTRYPARLVLEHGFTEWGLFWAALAVGMMFYFVETGLYKLAKLTIKRWKEVRAKKKEA